MTFVFNVDPRPSNSNPPRESRPDHGHMRGTAPRRSAINRLLAGARRVLAGPGSPHCQDLFVSGISATFPKPLETSQILHGKACVRFVLIERANVSEMGETERNITIRFPISDIPGDCTRAIGPCCCGHNVIARQPGSSLRESGPLRTGDGDGGAGSPVLLRRWRRVRAAATAGPLASRVDHRSAASRLR
jgi:hypothetical protein